MMCLIDVTKNEVIEAHTDIRNVCVLLGGKKANYIIIHVTIIKQIHVYTHLLCNICKWVDAGPLWK